MNDTTNITETEREFLKLLHKADAVFILDETGLRPFAWIRGFDHTPSGVNIKFGEGLDGKRAVRHLTITMGVSDREFKNAVAKAKTKKRKP